MVCHDIRSNQDLVIQLKILKSYTGGVATVAANYVEKIKSFQIYEGENYVNSYVIEFNKDLHVNGNLTNGVYIEFSVPNTILQQYIKGRRVNLRINYTDGSVDEHLGICSLKRDGILW